VASERQIAANQANARKSTGPRSSAGKRRASGNAHRHGLSVRVDAGAPLAPQLETRAHKIAGSTDDALTLEAAREIAQAERDLARVRQAKIAVIEQARAVGRADLPRDSVSHVDEVLKVTIQPPTATESEPGEPSPTMPSHDLDRSAQIIRRALPQLRRLDRYERHAVARRDRAVSQLGRMKHQCNRGLWNVQNEANSISPYQ
jgi:hypothetical protein